ncbi:hypothetical protein A9Q89_03100 [Gammaproteobacteria bacterium 53_120_T64]|nr:hypothetical protein A9Q89_03100 [Gammaproteobacteria bacterium 53_120_T64]
MSSILEIHIAKSGVSAPQKLQAAELVAGKGIVGDSYYKKMAGYSDNLSGLPAKELTLIESEEIDLFNKSYGFSFSYRDFRRDIVTRGARLNELVGKEFMLGDIRLRGISLCEPCAHLENLLAAELMPSLANKTGLSAEIISTGSIAVGDSIASHPN